MAVERVVIKLEGQVELILSPPYILAALRLEPRANLFWEHSIILETFPPLLSVISLPSLLGFSSVLTGPLVLLAGGWADIGQT